MREPSGLELESLPRPWLDCVLRRQHRNSPGAKAPIHLRTPMFVFGREVLATLIDLERDLPYVRSTGVASGVQM